MAEGEQSVWKGCSSQIVNVKPFVICLIIAIGLLVGAIVLYNQTEAGGYSWVLLVGSAGALLYLLIRFLDVRTTSYELTSQRLRTSHGILSKRIDELELYRVKDIALRKPLLLRMLGMGDIELNTSDQTTPIVLIRAVRQPDQLRDEVRRYVELNRDKKRVKEVDFT